jgi:hypothetical protein
MKIRMLKAVPGSVDGIRVHLYEAGTEHDLSTSRGSVALAAVFVAEGWAEDLSATPADDAQAPAGPVGRKPRQAKQTSDTKE